MGVLLAGKSLLAATSFPYEAGDAAAVAAGQVEQLVPECAGAKAGDDGEIEADIDDGATQGAAAHLGFELLQGKGVKIGRMVVAEAARQAGGGGARGGRGGLLVGDDRRIGRTVGRAVAGGRELIMPNASLGTRLPTNVLVGDPTRAPGHGLWPDIVAAGGAGEQDTLQRGRAQDAAMQAGDDQCEIRGAEAGGDGAEARCGGAAADGVREVAAVAQQDADHVQDCGDTRGDSSGRRRFLTIHGSYSNRSGSWWQPISQGGACFAEAQAGR